MKVLVVGGGGREHALVWALERSPTVKSIYAAPGNPGIARSATCVPVGVDDIDGLVSFARTEHVDLTVVGPEVPLGVGLVDRLEHAGLRAFGPSKAAAEIETSKAFAKQLMAEEGIPTATHRTYDNPDEAKAHVRQRGVPIVVKPSGLASGRGVVICHDFERADEAIERIMVEGIHGASGAYIVIEDYLEGLEASVFALTDGKTLCPLIPSQDHKQIYDDDKGPNTGGMGAYAPAPLIDDGRMDEIVTRILQPAIDAMAARGRPYRGVLYANLMVTSNDIQVLEFNCRFGDPEAQVLLPLLENDLAEVACAVSDGTLAEVSLKWRQEAAVCVVLASKGYPVAFEVGKPISGLETLSDMTGVIPFHAGTAIEAGRLVTSSGRVLGITALADNLPSAIDRAYEAANRVSFDGKYYRKDIGKKAFDSI